MDDIYYVISMIGKNNTKLYLACTKYDYIMSWTTDIDEACWFPTLDEADKFAKGYFTHFKSYFVVATQVKEVA